MCLRLKLNLDNRHTHPQPTPLRGLPLQEPSTTGRARAVYCRWRGSHVGRAEKLRVEQEPRKTLWHPSTQSKQPTTRGIQSLWCTEVMAGTTRPKPYLTPYSTDSTPQTNRRGMPTPSHKYHLPQSLLFIQDGQSIQIYETYEKARKKKTPVHRHKIKKSTEPDSQMTQILKLLDGDFKIIMTNMLMDLVRKGGQLAWTYGESRQRHGNYKKVRWKC